MNYFLFRKTDGRHIGFPFPVYSLTHV